MRFIVFLIFVSMYWLGQAQDWLWAVQISGNENMSTEKVINDSDNNIIVFSEIVGDVTVGSLNFTTNLKNMLILKFDKYGNILWSFQIGNSNIEDPKDAYVDALGNIYITGSFGGTLTFGDITINSTDEKDAFLAKLSKDGDIIWAKNMGQNTGVQKGRKITSDGNNLFVIGFYKESVLLSRANDTLLEGTNKKNYFFVKYDLDGNLIGARRIYSSSNSILLSGMIYLNNNIYLSGYFSDTLIYASDTLLSNNRSSDFLILKLDLNGNLVWAKQFGGPESDELWGLTTDGQDIYVSGFFSSGSSFILNNQTFESQGLNDIFIAKLDQNGNFLWCKSNGTDGDDRGHGITIEDNVLSVVGAFSYSLTWGNTIVANANTEPFLGTMTTDGTYIRAISVTSSSLGDSWGYDVDGDNNEHFYSVGKFSSASLAFNSNIQLNNPSPGNSNGFIAKYGCFDGVTFDITDAGCSGTNDGEITVTPNEGYGPFSYTWSNGATTSTISGLSEGDYTVTVSDVSGCSTIATAHITYHPPVNVSIQQTQDILCNGDTTAQIIAVASDGFSPYSYLWSYNSETSDTLSNLSAGNYIVTVTDQCGNEATSSITVAEPEALDVELSGEIYNYWGYCFAHIFVSALGGTPEYQYEWYDINGNLLGEQDNIWVWADDYYIIIITDANGCASGWYFYVPGCNKSMDNSNPELNTSEQYPEANISISFVSLPNNNNNNQNVNNGNVISRGNSEKELNKELTKRLKILGIGPKINIYPNPANEIINISFQSPYDINAQIILLNATGQIVKVIGWSQTNYYDNVIDISNLNNGIYFLMIKTDFGIFNERFSIIH